MLINPYSQIREKIDIPIKKAIKKRVFSGCSVGFFESVGKFTSGNIFHFGFSAREKENNIYEKAIYDLASLTKPLVTVLSLFKLIEKEKICFEETLDTFFPTTPAGKKNINIFQLLNHCSGFPAHVDYAADLLSAPVFERKEKIIRSILSEELAYSPGGRTVYSDLGYILLGRIVEQVSKKPLDVFWEESISKPLGLDKQLFFTGNSVLGGNRFVETGNCSWSKKSLYGVVNDDNCRALHGVAGHAGLFGSARGVLELCENLLHQHRTTGFPEVVQKQKNKKNKIKPGFWYYGFDTPTPGLSSSGKYFSEQTVGHLGFTGTSFWLDLKRGIAVVFLTNRVLFEDKVEEIKKIRPQIHNIIMSDLLKKP